MSDFNVQIKVRNGRIVRAMRAAGFKSVAQLCRAMGVDGPANQQQVGLLLNLKKSPITKYGEWSTHALSLAAALGVPEECLWPEHLAKLQLRSNTADFDTTQEQLGVLLASPRYMDRKALATMLDCCTPREQELLRLRFGLDGDVERTLSDVGEKMGVTQERVRQIEIKAMGRMRQAAKRLRLERAEDVLEPAE